MCQLKEVIDSANLLVVTQSFVVLNGEILMVASFSDVGIHWSDGI